MKLHLFASLLAASLFASPALVRAQDEGAKPEKKDETPAPDKKPDENPPPNRDRGQRGGGRFGRQWGGIPVDQLKEKLGLSDDQVKKLEAINDESREQAKKDMQELQKGGDFDWNKMREHMQQRMKELQDKVRGILTDAQKPKFDEWAKDMEQRMQRGPRGMGRDPEAMKKRLLDQAEKELVLSPEEKSAVIPLIQKVLDARAEARTQGDKRKEEFTQFVRKASGTDDAQKAEIQKRLDDYRKARDAEQQKIKDAQQQLREVLTIDNEAKLVGLGILD